jgi:hypothetical protein
MAFHGGIAGKGAVGRRRFSVMRSPPPPGWIVWDNTRGVQASETVFADYGQADKERKRIERSTNEGTRRIRRRGKRP